MHISLFVPAGDANRHMGALFPMALSRHEKIHQKIKCSRETAVPHVLPGRGGRPGNNLFVQIPVNRDCIKIQDVSVDKCWNRRIMSATTTWPDEATAHHLRPVVEDEGPKWRLFLVKAKNEGGECEVGGRAGMSTKLMEDHHLYQRYHTWYQRYHNNPLVPLIVPRHRQHSNRS